MASELYWKLQQIEMYVDSKELREKVVHAIKLCVDLEKELESRDTLIKRLEKKRAASKEEV